jgi:hypothetical protein
MSLPEALVHRIKSYAPEHAVRMAPVLRAIHFVEDGNILDVFTNTSELNFCEDSFYVDERAAQVCVEAIYANTRLRTASFVLDTDLRMIEAVLAKPSLTDLTYMVYRQYEWKDQRQRFENTFLSLRDLKRLRIDTPPRGRRTDIRWDSLIAQVVTNNSRLKDVCLSLLDDKSAYSETAEALAASSVTTFELETCGGACHLSKLPPGLTKVVLFTVTARSVMRLVDILQCEHLTSLQIIDPMFANGDRISTFIKCVTNLIRRAPHLQSFEINEQLARRQRDSQKEDGGDFVSAVSKSELTSLKLSDTLFKRRYVDAIRAVCEEKAIQFDLML